MSTNAVKVSSGFTQYPFTTHIGEAGRLFYNAATGELRISDGHTPGGLPVYTAVGAANIGNLVITNTTIGTYSANANINIQTNGSGIINLVGNIGFFTTAAGITGTPLLTVDNLGNLVVNGQLNVNGATTFIGNVYHQGYTQFIGNTSHTGNLVITGQATNNGLSIFNGDLTINGNARLVGNTNVTGNTTVTGNVLVTGTTTVTGNTYVTGNVLVTGTTTVAGNTFVTGFTTVTGTTTVIGNTYVTGQVTTITGNTYLQGNSFVTGAMSVTGNSVQTGLATYIVSTVNTTQGAVEITGDVNGSYQTPVNQGVMLQVTGQLSLPSRLYNDGQNNYAVYSGRRYNGSITAPTQVLNNQDVVRFGGTAYTSGGWFGNGIARFAILANEDQTLTTQGSRIELLVTPNGSNSSSISNVVTLTSSLMTVKTDIVTTGNLIGNVTGTATRANVATNLSAASSILAGQVNIPAQTIPKNTASVDVTVTVTGLTTSHKVIVTPAADLNAGIFVTAGYPTTANTLGIQLQNTNAGGLTTSAFNLTYWAWI